MKFKKVSLLLLAVITANSFMACSLPFAHVTGDQIVAGNSNNLVIQANIKMDESNVNSLTGGQISEILVSEGDTVTKGQALVALDCDSLLAQKSSGRSRSRTSKGRKEPSRSWKGTS